MADTKISALPAASTLAGTEVLPVVQDGATKAATAGQVAALVDLSGKADASTVAALSDEVGTKADADAVTTALAGKADASDVTALAGTVQAASESVSVNTVAASTTIDAARHDGSLIVVNASSAVTVTLADDLAAGTVVNILQRGTGAVTITGDTDTLNVPTGRSAVIAGQWQMAMAIKVATGQWVLIGALGDAA